MKILPCRALCHGQPALLTKNTPQPYTLGAMPDHAIIYICARCGRPSRISADEFARLPDAADASDAV